MTRLSVFIASSIDGYIATLDDKLDWLDAAAVPGEDYGYEPFISTVDALAMGRGTYDFISHIDPLPFGDRKVFVFTHNPPQPREGVIFWQISPLEALAVGRDGNSPRVRRRRPGHQFVPCRRSRR